ncbi:MAG: hypothetical protein U0821_08645 [Chloroflexota bacterium]
MTGRRKFGEFGALLAAEPAEPAHGRVFILSGPSGVGKSSIIGALRGSNLALGYCVTATTRARRPAERDGLDYFFLEPAEFAELRETNQLLEHSQVHGRSEDTWYGIPVASIRAALRAGDDVLIPPEVQGAEKIRRRLGDAVVTVFVSPVPPREIRMRLGGKEPESVLERDIQFERAVREALESRLTRRIEDELQRDAPDQRDHRRREKVDNMLTRLQTSVDEMERMRDYEYVVVNEDGCLDSCVDQVRAIIMAERCRYRRRVVTV